MARFGRRMIVLPVLLALVLGVYRGAAAQSTTVDASPGALAAAMASSASVVSDTQAAAAAPGTNCRVVGDTPITLPEFKKRYHIQVFLFQRQLETYQAMEEQFGNQGFFTGQISVTHSLLISPTALVPIVLSKIKEEAIIGAEAQRRKIGVTDNDIDAGLREEIGESLTGTGFPAEDGETPGHRWQRSTTLLIRRPSWLSKVRSRKPPA